MLEEGRVFSLGGITVEVVPMKGHTQGSIGLLVREHNVLFTSDAANSHVWMFLEESTTVADYIKMLERVIKLPFDTFFVGHQDDPRPKSEMERYMNVAKNIDIEKSSPYRAFMGLSGTIYEEGDVAIVYNPEKLKN
jgi:glyoxylase-like metal-dependent hydrolase (beta-lactamase superfamily II)